MKRRQNGRSDPGRTPGVNPETVGPEGAARIPRVPRGGEGRLRAAQELRSAPRPDPRRPREERRMSLAAPDQRQSTNREQRQRRRLGNIGIGVKVTLKHPSNARRTLSCSLNRFGNNPCLPNSCDRILNPFTFMMYQLKTTSKGLSKLCTSWCPTRHITSY